MTSIRSYRARRAAVLATLALLGSGSALAHPGHGAGDLLAGLAHPFEGLDHLLAMLAVGLWAATALRGARQLAAPGAFIAALVVGAALAVGGLALPALEAGVAATLPTLALMLLGARRLGTTSGLLLVAAAGLLHGQAHGSELAAGASFAAFAAGFVAASALLHGAGLGLGAVLARVPAWATRVAAALLGATGVLLLAGRLA